jgi:hypothetical protein
MKTKSARTIVSLTALCLLPMALFAQGSPLPLIGYAESLYQQYAADASGKISFQVATQANGPLSGIAGKPFESILSVPPYRIETDEDGTVLLMPAYTLPDDPTYGLDDMKSSVDDFQSMGRPVSMGAYRRLLVTVNIAGDVRSHQAMEFCWSSLSQCAVLDPVVVFLQSKVDNIASLIANHWGLEVTDVQADVLPGGGGGGHCGLASNPSVKSRTYHRNGYIKGYTNVFGQANVIKVLGQQTWGIRCDVSCNPHGFANSYTSSAWGTNGWTAKCAQTPADATGETGSRGTSLSEAKCTHKWVQIAKASVSIEGKGSASVDGTWTLGGGVDSNGGRQTDSCGWF